MDSYKVVIFMPNNAKGSSMLKKLFQKQFKIPEANKKSLFDYFSFTVDMITVDWKIYLVSDLVRFEEIRPIYFTNVHTYIVVLDLANFRRGWKKFLEAIKLHRGNSKVICLGYSRKNGGHKNVEDVVEKEMGKYFQFSEISDLEAITEYLFYGRGGLRSWNEPPF